MRFRPRDRTIASSWPRRSWLHFRFLIFDCLPRLLRRGRIEATNHRHRGRCHCGCLARHLRRGPIEATVARASLPVKENAFHDTFLVAPLKRPITGTEAGATVGVLHDTFVVAPLKRPITGTEAGATVGVLHDTFVVAPLRLGCPWPYTRAWQCLPRLLQIQAIVERSQQDLLDRWNEHFNG